MSIHPISDLDSYAYPEGEMPSVAAETENYSPYIVPTIPDENAADLVYFACNGQVVCLDLSRYAQPVWRQTDPKNAWVAGSPTTLVTSGASLFLGFGGRVWKLSAVTGEIAWKNDLKGLRLEPLSIITNRQQVFVGTHGTVVALNRIDGSELWSIRLPYAGNRPVNLSARDSVLYAGSHGAIYALQPLTAQLMWHVKSPRWGGVTTAFYQARQQLDESDLLLFASNGRIQTVKAVHHTYVDDGHVFRDEVPTHEIISECNLRRTGWNPVSMIMTAGTTGHRTLFVATGSKVTARDPLTMDQFWETSVLATHCSSLLYVENIRYMSIREGWLRKKGSGYNKKWRKNWYYHDKEERYPVRIMPLHNCTVDTRTILKASDEYQSWTMFDNDKNCPEFYLNARTLEEKDAWIADIHAVTASLTSGVRLSGEERGHYSRDRPSAPRGGDYSGEVAFEASRKAFIGKGGVAPSWESDDAIPPHSNVLYVGGKDTVEAIAPETGTKYWTTHLRPSQQGRAGHMTPLMFHNGLLYATCTGLLVGMDPITGKVILVEAVAQRNLDLSVLENWDVSSLCSLSTPMDQQAQPLIPYWQKDVGWRVFKVVGGAWRRILSDEAYSKVPL